MTNDTETLTLSDFLLARIAEDEAAARESLETGYQPPPWGPEDKPEFVPDFYDPPTDWDRRRVARVLAECEAKRRIVRLHSPDHTCTDGGRNYPGVFSGALDGFEVCLTLRALAAVYSDHPDYRADWP